MPQSCRTEDHRFMDEKPRIGLRKKISTKYTSASGNPSDVFTKAKSVLPEILDSQDSGLPSDFPTNPRVIGIQQRLNFAFGNPHLRRNCVKIFRTTSEDLRPSPTHQRGFRVHILNRLSSPCYTARATIKILLRIYTQDIRENIIVLV